ncbi:MAG: tRNA (adenosine(37)-N6)-dimethylallyltransferase MiaA [bacterium]
METKNKIIVILGQTATGKSDYAVEVALYLKKIGINAEIISADSRQVYKNMNIGTGKITKKEMRGVPHHMLDVINPKKIYTVANYQKDVDKILKDIYKRGTIPIICGGTGFYIDAVVDGTILPEVPPDETLRKELAKQTTEQLYKTLVKLDKNRASAIDKNNKVRLIRAIEIVKTLGKVPQLKAPKSPFEVLKIGLALPDEVLKNKIKIRLLARMKKGMMKEIESLHSPKQGFGLTWKRLEALGLEYRYGALCLQGKITKEKMLEELNTEIWHYAKRQNTWFKRDQKTVWIDSREIHEKARGLMKIKEFLR